MTTTYQDPYYSAGAYYQSVPPQNVQQPMTNMQTYQGPVQAQGPSYPVMQPAMQYQYPYSQPQGYDHSTTMPQQSHSYGKHKQYTGNKQRSARHTYDHSNVGCEAVNTELEAIKKKTVVYTDAECQTDFPEHIANKTLSERPVEELVPLPKAVTKSTGNQTGEDGGDSSSESGREEETRPQDSDSGYSGTGAYPPVSRRDGSYERRDWSDRSQSSDSAAKSYASVASQRYTPQPPHTIPYQQQWPAPPSTAVMATQMQSGPIKTPTSSFASIVAGAHQPSHPPPMVPHGYNVGPPPQPMVYHGQIPPMQSQPVLPQGSETGGIRARQENKKSRKGKKKNEMVLTQVNQHPPPQITDSNEYPELPTAMVAAPFHQGYGNYQQNLTFSNILQQKKSPNEVDSDTSSDKEGPPNSHMMQSEDQGIKNFRKKGRKTSDPSKKPAQEYQNIAAEQTQTTKKSGKRSQRPVEFDLGAVLTRPPPPAPQAMYAHKGPMQYGPGIPYGGQPVVMGYQQNVGPPGHQWNASQVRSGPGVRGSHIPSRETPVHRKAIGTNPLDASAPVMKGKVKENPTKKKPSAMKKVIMAERLEKKRIRDLQASKLSDNEDALTQSTAELDSVCYDSSLGLSQDAPSDRNSLSINTSHSDMSPLSQPEPLSLSPLSPGMGSPTQNGSSSSQSEVLAMKRIHSNKFREYCKQMVTKEIDACCTTLLQTLVKFQERQYNRDGPAKAKSKRRIVMGLREVSKHLEKKKIQCIVISPNLEKIQSKGGIDDVLNKITTTAEEQDVPVIFALCRSALGRAVNKIVPVSVVGVFSYNGAEETFKQLIELANNAREEYQILLQAQKRDIEMKNAKNIGKHLGHRRNISNCSGISFKSFISEPISENDPEPEPDLDLESNLVCGPDIAEQDQPDRGLDELPSEMRKDEYLDSGSVVPDGSTEKSNSEASACTVEDRHKKQLVMQDQSYANIEEEEAADEDKEDEDEEREEGLLAPEVSTTERVNSWVAETQSQVHNLSLDDPEENMSAER